MKVNTVMAISTGWHMGSMMRMKERSGPAPSMVAASSKSLGMPLMKERIRNTL